MLPEANFDDARVPSADDLLALTRLNALSLQNGSVPPGELIEAIRAELEQVGRFAFRRIEVALEDDRVVLRGIVRTWFQKQLAQHVAMQTPGVPRVVNELIVDWNRLRGA